MRVVTCGSVMRRLLAGGGDVCGGEASVFVSGGHRGTAAAPGDGEALSKDTGCPPLQTPAGSL